MNTYRIVLYFENGTVAEEAEFKAPEGMDTDAVFDLAAAEYEDYTVNYRPVYVGSLYSW